MQPNEKPKHSFGTTMRYAFEAAVMRQCEDRALRRVVVNKLRSGAGIRKSTAWRVTR